MSLPIEGRCLLAQTAHKFSFMDWWLPPNYSAHGGQIDYLFYWIFGITAAALVIVQAVLVWFLIKYRRHPGNTKSHFIHGNTKLEMAWTLTPAVILAVLALASKVAWHNYRYNPDPDKVQVMVVGEQFKWNVIYAGPDNQVGTYMRFPHVSDPKFRTRDARAARKAINDYMQFENPLGKAPTARPEGASGSWVDPGDDDDNVGALGRPLIIPEHRTVDILLSSKDVLHDFAIPNFRAMLDAVPGMIGHIYFKPQRRSTALEKIEDIPLNKPLWIDRDTPTAVGDRDADFSPTRERAFKLMDPAGKEGQQGIESLGTLRTLVEARLGPDARPEQFEAERKKLVEDFKKAGVHHLTTVSPFEIVCRELCGMGHGTMKAELIVVSDKEYDNYIYRNAPPEKRTGRKFYDPSKTGPQIAGTQTPPALARREAAPSNSR